MQKIIKTVSSMFLSLAICLGVAAVAFTGYTVADAATDYYAGITATGGDELLGQVHDLITKTHKRYSSYADCRTYGSTTDPGSGNNTVLEFYTHIDISNSKWDVSGGWNREHVWAKSLSNGLWGTSGGGSDLHHIRPAEKDLNNHRSSKKYGEVGNSGTEEYTSVSNVLGGHSTSSTFEPLDNVKGDVARIVMYVYTHYNTYSNVHGTTNGSGSYFGTLNFTHIISASNESKAKELLLEWNALDPVDEIETTRNEAVYEIQGNRNPFIDHPEYANAIWGDGTVSPDPGPGPSDTLKGLSLNASSLTLTAGQTYDLKVTPNPSNASASVTWTSSNPSVATVSGGKVTAKAAGTVTVTATSTVNSSIKATATVTVINSSSSEITGEITITRDSFSNASGSYAFQSWTADDISGTAYMYGGNQKAMQFNTSKSSQYIASTTPTGGAIKKVTISASGNSAWSLLTSSQPYGELSSGNPTDGNSQTGDGNSQTGDGSSWTVSGNDTYFALVLGGGGAAYVDSIVVEYGAGTSSENPDKLENLYINPSEVNLKKGESSTLTVTGVPSTASAEVVWSSSDPTVVSVSSDGTVNALKTGTVTITATGKVDSSIQATATVNVTADIVSDNAKVQAFHEAVEAINEDGAFSQRLESINNARTLYNGLSSDEKLQAAADVTALSKAIANFYNAVAEKAEHSAMGGVGGFLNGRSDG